MNWDAIGAVAESLGAIATVATLAYLALQIRQNTRMGQIATATARIDQRAQQAAFISQSSDINRLFWTGLHDPESLSADEYRHFESIFSTYLVSNEAAFNFNQENALSEAEWAGQIAAINWLLSTPGFRSYWSAWRDSYAADYSDFVDASIRESEFSIAPPAPGRSGRGSPPAQQNDTPDSA